MKFYNSVIHLFSLHTKLRDSCAKQDVISPVIKELNHFELLPICDISFEPRHDKTNKVTVRPAKTQISLGIRPV